MTTKPTHGGARKGAGRKPLPAPRKPRYVRLNDAEVAVAIALGKTVSEGVQEAIRRVSRNTFPGNRE